jgi:hypothetical protein
MLLAQKLAENPQLKGEAFNFSVLGYFKIIG